MKKLIYCALALAAGLFATSCQQENLEPVAQGNTVTFEVSIPEVATKGLGDNVSNINDLVYAVYSTTATTLENVQNGSAGYELLYQKNYATDVNPFNGGNTAIIPIELVNDKNYFVIFWAQNEDRWVGESFDLRRVAYPEAGMNANDNDYAAFSGISFITSDNLSAKKSVILKRPFAQINIGTQLATEFTITPTTSSVTVNKAGTSFNLIKQVAEGEGSVTFNTANVPTNPDRTDGKLVVNNTEYTYAAMNYVFANGNVDVEYTINTAAHGAVSNTVANVPVAANYRTNIVGRLLTSTADYTVVLDEFDTNNNSGTTEVITEGLVKNQNGDYEISTDNGLIHAINNLWVDKNGAADPATFYVYPQVYNITDDQIKDVEVTSGTLKVIKDKPVMTRSIGIDGIVIKGLSKPLIASVGEDATVVISGVTIQTSEDNDEQVAALIGVNNGKVIIENCDVIDENAAPDTTTELIGVNNGTVTEPENVDEGEVGVVYDAVQLAAAFADAEVDAIVLGADITLEDVLVFPEGRTATLDLKGYKLTYTDEDKEANTYAINNHGTLTIKDSYGVGEVNARGIYNGYVAGGDPIATAKLIIEGGNFNAKGTNGGAAVFNYGVAEIKGGKFTSIGGYSLNNQGGASMTISEGVKVNNGIYNSGATLTINGGEIEGNRSGCHVVYSWNSTVTIKGGTIHNNNSGNSTLMAAGTSEMTVTGGTFSIKDGRVEGNGNTWTSCLTDTQHTATLTVTGGTFNGGFRVQGGTTMNISGGTFNDVGGSGYNVYTGATIEITGGSYNIDVNKWCHKDYKAVKNAETTMWDVVAKVYVAEVVGGETYETLQEAVNNVSTDATIKLLTDIEQTDGVLITDKNLIIDLDGNTFTVTEGSSTNNRNFKINGASVVTIKNGTMVATGTANAGAYGTVRSEDTAIVTLDGLQLFSYRGNGLNVKACSGTTVTINNSQIYATYGGGVEAAGGEVELNNVTINQQGVHTTNAWNSVAIGVNGGGKVTINSGAYNAAAIASDANAAQGTWVAYVMTSGGTLEINGGTFNGTVAETAAAANACGLICADTKAVVNIYDGTFNSNGAILDMRNNTGGSPNPVATLYGGTFSADPTVSGLYGSNLISVEEGKKAFELADGRWVIVAKQATVNNEAQLKEAFELGQDIVLGSNITLNENWVPIGNAEAPYSGVIDGNNHKISGLKVEGVEYAAFISHTASGAVVKNLTLENVDLNSTKHAAGVVCVAGDGLTIENVTVSGEIVAASYGAGLVHNAPNATIKHSTNNANVTAVRAGGIASWVTTGATIENVVNNGDILGTDGGASGIAHGFAGKIKKAVNNGNITSNGIEPAAGIVGVQKSNSTYEYCYNYGNVISTLNNPNSSAAGILGQNPGSTSTLTYCANFGDITANESYAAGIGYGMYANGVTSNYCYNEGTISGADGAGAISPKPEYGTTNNAKYCLNNGAVISDNGTTYQASVTSTYCYYYNGNDLLNVTGNTAITVEEALAVLNGGADKAFFTTEDGKIVVK